MLDKFKTSLQASLDYCLVCNWIIFTDKIQKMSNTHFRDVCPAGVNRDISVDVALCTKCTTQIVKQQWPSCSVDNGLAPDDIPVELASDIR